MKILMLMGSYRRHGNTAQVVDLIGKHLEKLAVAQGVPLEIETLDLGERKLEDCRGCRACFDRGEERCPLKDDMPEVRARMRTADGLVIASPIYVEDVSGLVKTWIDRQAYACHRPEFAGKCAYAVTTAGNFTTQHSGTTLRRALETWGFYMVGYTRFITGALSTPEEILARHDKAAEKAARRLFTAIHTRAFTRPTLVGLVTFRVQQAFWQRISDDSFDLQYWKDQGWLDPQRKFYFPVEVSPAKTALVRLAATLVNRFLGG